MMEGIGLKNRILGKVSQVTACFMVLYLSVSGPSVLLADENVDDRVVAEVVQYWESVRKREARVKALVQADMMMARTPSQTAVIEQVRLARKKTKAERKQEVRELRRQRLAGKKGVRALKKKGWADRISLGWMVRSIYDDNVFLQRQDRVSGDVIIRTTPVVALDLGFGKVDIDAVYVADWHCYIKHERQRRVDHNFRTHASIPVFKGLSVIGDYELVRAANRATSEVTGFYLYTRNSFEGEIYYDIGQKLAFSAEYSYRNFHYSDSIRDRDNWLYHRLTPTLYYKYSPKTFLFAQAMVGKVKGGNSRYNSTDWYVSTGVKGRLSAKMVAHINVGFLRRSFSKSKPNLDTPRVKLVLIWGITPKDTLSAVGNWDSEQTSSASNFYVSMSAFARWKHAFTKRLSVAATFGLRENRYPTLSFAPRNIPGAHSGKRKDKFLDVTGSVRYDFTDWLYGEFSYRFNNRNSNFDQNDFKENEFTAGFGGEF